MSARSALIEQLEDLNRQLAELGAAPQDDFGAPVKMSLRKLRQSVEDARRRVEILLQYG